MEIRAIGCEPLSLKRMHIQDGHTLKVYKDTGGYQSLKKALQMAPADIIEEVKKRLKIWKKEHLADGSAKWVHGKETINL